MKLSPRQTQVIEAIKEHYGNKQFRLSHLAHNMGLSPSCVDAALRGLIIKGAVKKDKFSIYSLK